MSKKNAPLPDNSIVLFKAYQGDITADEPQFTPGMRLRIVESNIENGEQQYTVEPEDGSMAAQIVFADEIEETGETSASDLETVSEEAPEAAPEPAKKKAAAKKAPAKKETAPAKAAKKKAEEPAKAPAKGKGKASKTEEAPEAAPAKAPAKKKSASKKSEAPALQVVEAEAEVVEQEELPNLNLEPSEEGASPMSASVASALHDMDGDAIEAARALVNQTEETYYALGGVLVHIFETKAHQAIADEEGNLLYGDSKGFDNFVEQEIGLKKRKAAYLMQIYRHFSALGVDEKRLTAIGWSKAKNLVACTDADNFEEFAEFAANHTTDELDSFISSRREDGGDGSGDNRVTRKTFRFKFFEDKAAIIEDALNAAKATLDTEDANEALEFIISEWLSAQANVEVPLEQAIEVLNRKYGVNLVEGEADTEEVSEEGEEYEEQQA